MEYGIMKMTLCMIISLLTMFSIMQASACPLKGETTGSACSVKELQKLEKQRTQDNAGFSGFNLKGEKNLRPVKLSPEVKNPEQTQCIFCLQESLFGKVKP